MCLLFGIQYAYKIHVVCIFFKYYRHMHHAIQLGLKLDYGKLEHLFPALGVVAS